MGAEKILNRATENKLYFWLNAGKGEEKGLGEKPAISPAGEIFDNEAFVWYISL